ncbi:hypothetical protein CDAR_596651 [Caerostris darwini]|uniref:Uncharacterized protein n=1 Tax=Caerostris darwini TaxID=1538125 RepID=A0AAV4WC94_9ARAC|nr:hypothetical protein CDAR_596651 [Caerostris darwini]
MQVIVNTCHFNGSQLLSRQRHSYFNAACWTLNQPEWFRVQLIQRNSADYHEFFDCGNFTHQNITGRFESPQRSVLAFPFDSPVWNIKKRARISGLWRKTLMKATGETFSRIVTRPGNPRSDSGS